MVWGCFTASSVGPLVKIEGIMNDEMYRDNTSGEYADNLHTCVDVSVRQRPETLLQDSKVVA